MVRPIHALHAVAARINSGVSANVSQSSDDLEMLADQFNEMAGKLRQS